MPILVDPDDLNLGTETTPGDADWGTPAGMNVTITSTGNLPVIASGEYFAVINHPAANNNGLYIATGVPTTSSLPSTKISGAAPTDEAASATALFYGTTGASTELSVWIDTDAKDIYLCEQGNLTSDGVTEQCLYSFSKIQWKSKDWLPGHAYPIIMITPEQGEFVEGWNPQDNVTHSIRSRKLVRTGGWSEIDASGYLLKQYPGIITLGDFEDEANDTAYYNLGNDPTDIASTIDFSFAGPVNEAIQTYDYVTPADAITGFDIASNSIITRNDGGNWFDDGYRVGGDITTMDAEIGANDGTWEIAAVEDSIDGDLTVVGTPLSDDTGDQAMSAAVDNRRAVAIYLRIRDGDTNGKTFAYSDLPSIGKTSVDNKAFSFPISNATDLNITATDAQITGGPPWDEIFIRYFNASYSRDVDTPGVARDFGIVIDAGTHSARDGVTTAGTTITTAEAGIPATTFDGGVCRIHEGTDKGDHTITTATGNTVNLSASLTDSETDISFTLYQSTPLNPDKYEVFEKVQYQLRQGADIDETGDVVNGKTADILMAFEGTAAKIGQSIPANPNGGGTGVIIEGFDPNDTNDLTFWDNTGTERTYPYVAAGNIAWNIYLEEDVNGYFWMFFTYTERFTNAGFGTSASSNDTCTLDSSITDLTAELANGDYITLNGFTDPDVDGIYVCTNAPSGSSPWEVDLRRVNGKDCVDEAEGATVSLDKNPVDTPDAIIVQNNSSADIKGSTYGTSGTSFDFDYDNNVQGGRTAGTDAAVTLRALGYDGAQWVEAAPGVISQAVGLSFSLVAALERNYSNP